MPHRHILALLLAAGSGRRFDPSGVADKLTQILPGGVGVGVGMPVAVASAKNLLAAGLDVLAVVRSNDTLLAQQLRDLGCTVSACATAGQGMSASLVHGLKHAQQAQAHQPDAGGWLVALADMPYIHTSTIRLLVRAIEQGADIAVPVHQGRRGNPVAFSRFHLARLLALQGDQGARSLLQAWPLVAVDVEDAGILQDIDEPADLG